MYVNQIDNIIDTVLDKLYLEGLSHDPTFKLIIENKKIDYVEYRDKINEFIQNFMKTIDINEIQKLINNKENLARIIDIIKRYIAYYYFLTIGYYYTGTIKEFRNNLIQYSKLQESSAFTIKNFFDTENNYQIIKFYKIIKEVSKIITMTDLQKKTLNPLEVKDSLAFLNSLGRNYIDNYLLMLVKRGGGDEVEINVHNLIKTIVFGEIYRNQERNFVFEIVNDIEEDKHEYIYIDIVVTTDDITDFDSFRQIFIGDENVNVMAQNLFELVTLSSRIVPLMSMEFKNNNLFRLGIVPIVDDFLRYHRDSEKLDTDNEKTFFMPPVSTNNAKNIQLALLYQQRKKKENTRAQLIVNKIDIIQDYYSLNIKNNPELKKDIQKYFQNPLSYRKAILHNYLDEVKVIKKILDIGKKLIEGYEYFLELLYTVSHAYFNFKDFQKYGTSINLENDLPINMLRYNNIENINQMTNLELDMHTGISDSTISLVGLATGPIIDGPIQCVKKSDLVNIRGLPITYMKEGKKITRNTQNGYKAFMAILKYFYVGTINFSQETHFQLINDFEEIQKLNPNIVRKVIYWVYDVNEDLYKMDAYEDLKSYNFQEIIKFMNSKIHDKMSAFLHRRLLALIKKNDHLNMSKIELLIELFSKKYRLFLSEGEKMEMIIKEYLRREKGVPEGIAKIGPADMIPIPKFTPRIHISSFLIRIDMANPLHPKEHIKLEAYTNIEAHSKEFLDSITSRAETKCQHENEWNEIQKLKGENLNKYNSEMTQFLEKFAIETNELDFICRICGQILPIKQYVQDGKFDNNTQKFVTIYLPLDIALEDVKEYAKYKLIIRHLDGLISRISLMTGTNMLVGPSIQTKQKRKALVKNIVDLFVKHNTINLKQKQGGDASRADFYAKKFNIDKDLDSLFFFELDDSMFNFSPSNSEVNADLNRFKFNNLMLYFILIFMAELNGTQIAMMYSDKRANIYTYLKYGPKLFGDLLLRKNINNSETVAITKYPVLCYLIFLISYFLVKYGLWYYPSANLKSYNPIIIKIIINSLVDLFNSISIEAGKMPNDYIYLLSTSKLYAQLNNTFRNSDIINVLKRNHIKWSTDKLQVPIMTDEDIIKTYYLSNPPVIIRPTRKIPNYKLTSGIIFDRPDQILYNGHDRCTDVTNCPYGSYHFWISRQKGAECIFCQEKGADATGTIDRSTENYYYIMNKVANRRCLEGTVHNFVSNGKELVCTICHRKKTEIFTIVDTNDLSINLKESQKQNIVNSILEKFHREIKESYTRQDLDRLASNLNKLEDIQTKKALEEVAAFNKAEAEIKAKKEALVQNLMAEYQAESGDKLFGQIVVLSNKLIKMLEELIGVNVNLDIDKYPVHLTDDVYIIDHSYDGSLLQEPLILFQKDQRVIFKEDNPFFKTDVYYYSDNRTQIDVYYHAVTLKLLGYREKHKDYVRSDKTNNYLKINASIKNRLLSIGYQTKYIDIGKAFELNMKSIKDADKNYFQILDSLIRDHILKIRSSIDKMSSILYKIKNYVPQDSTSQPPSSIVHSAQQMETLVSKYGKLIKDLSLGENDDAMNDWNYIRSSFTYKPINWRETNVRPTEKMYVSSSLISYYDVSSNLMMYYLINELVKILKSNPERITKTNIAQLYIEMINYIYNLYNMDKYLGSFDLKRFMYILNGSGLMIDILEKGQGLVKSRIVEEDLKEAAELGELAEMGEEKMTEEEREKVYDLEEEAQALDVDEPLFEEDADEMGEMEYEEQ